MGRRRLIGGAVLAAAALGMPGPAAAQVQPVFEEYAVPTVGGATINVEVMRPAANPDAPVILTYSPYNTLSETVTPNLANDELGQRYVEEGYARAVADVLGTRNSSGCWDYGGPLETRSGVDLVNFLAGRPWSNGRVAMIGGSYDGTTANLVAAPGADVPGLRAIVPMAAISRWYGYAYSHGIRYLGNSERPTDEGADTPLAFDFGIARTPPTDPSDPGFIDTFLSRINPCDSVAHTQAGYDDSPDYNRFWLERDYRRHAASFRAAVLLAHGWQDYNVKQEEGVKLFEALPEDDPGTAAREGVPFKLLYMFQDGHTSPGAANWQPLLDRFFARTLQGIANGIAGGPEVLTEGRSASAESTGFSAEPSWPPPGTARVALFLDRAAAGGTLRPSRPATASRAAYTDTATQTEEVSKQQPGAETNWLFYKSQALASDTRLAGEALLDATVSVDRAHAHLTPVLVDIAPDGEVSTVSRGFLNLLYREGLARERPLPVGEPVAARVTFKPQDQTFEAGHRIGVILQSSNAVWAIPDDPGAEVTVEHGGAAAAGASRLKLPLVGAGGAAGLFD
jgi:X-Pro dipeptidyl-peptidase